MEKPNIAVDIREAYRYLGCTGSPEGEIEKELIRAASLVERESRPRYIEKICNIDRSGGISLAGTDLSLEGKAIAALLHDSVQCAIFCATIGGGIDALIRRCQITDIAFAAMLDACASSAIESLCNIIEDGLREESASRGMYITDRFSPGYGDLPLSIQPDFCAELDTARKIGVVVGENSMMIPVKSVTAIIGISKKNQKHFDTGCRNCPNFKSCKFRENGVTCYGRAV